MKKKIHPKVYDARITCACGESFTALATMEKIKVEICSKCHPFFTGKQKFVDTAGRVEKFQQKYGDASPLEVYGKKKKAKAENEERRAEPSAQIASSEEGS